MENHETELRLNVPRTVIRWAGVFYYKHVLADIRQSDAAVFKGFWLRRHSARSDYGYG